MNIFIPSAPNAVVLMDPHNNVIATANNIDRDFRLVITRDRGEYETLAANKPFDSSRPQSEQQTLSSAASKARYANTTTSVEACLPVGSLTNDGKLVTKS